MEKKPRAQSRYRQIRLTCTAETNARVAYSIAAKGLGDQWDQHTVIVRDLIPWKAPLASTEDVIAMLLVVLADQILPESPPV